MIGLLLLFVILILIEYFYERAIHIKGKLFWTGVRDDEEADLVHFIMCYNTCVKDISTRDIELIDDGLPKYITVVDNKIGVVFRQIVTDERVIMNLWVSQSDDLSQFNLVHLLKIDRLTQDFDVIGFEDDCLVLSNSSFRNGGFERDIIFCNRVRYFTRTVHENLPRYSNVNLILMYQFSDVVF